MRIYRGQILPIVFFATAGATADLSKGEPPPASAPRPHEIRARTVRSTADLIEVSFQIPPIQLHSDPKSPGSTRVGIAGWRTHAVDGYPDVPVITQYIAIPSCERVELDAFVEGIEETRNINFAITNERPDPSGRSARPPAMTKPNRKGADFPRAWARLVDIQYLRGQALARVEIFPVRYSAQRSLLAPREITIRLRPINAAGSLAVHAGPLQPVLDALVPNCEGFTPAVSDNPGRRLAQSEGGHVFWCETDDDDWEAAAEFVSVSAEADYLMIVADELVADAEKIDLIQQLADWHAAYHGFNVAIVRMKQIDDPLLIFASGGTPGTPSIIRDFIKEIYDSGSALHMGDGRLGYVLLVGDAYNPDDQVRHSTLQLAPAITRKTRTRRTHTIHCSRARHSVLTRFQMY